MKYSITVLVFNTTIIAINSLMEIQKGCANLPHQIKVLLPSMRSSPFVATPSKTGKLYILSTKM